MGSVFFCVFVLGFRFSPPSADSSDGSANSSSVRGDWEGGV